MTRHIADLVLMILGRLTLQRETPALIIRRKSGQGIHENTLTAEVFASARQSVSDAGELRRDGVLRAKVGASSGVPIALATPSTSAATHKSAAEKCAGPSGVDGAGPGKTDARGGAPSPGRVPGWK